MVHEGHPVEFSWGEKTVLHHFGSTPSEIVVNCLLTVFSTPFCICRLFFYTWLGSWAVRTAASDAGELRPVIAAVTFGPKFTYQVRKTLFYCNFNDVTFFFT